MLLGYLGGNEDDDSGHQAEAAVPSGYILTSPDAHVADPAGITVHGGQQIGRRVCLIQIEQKAAEDIRTLYHRPFNGSRKCQKNYSCNYMGNERNGKNPVKGFGIQRGHVEVKGQPEKITKKIRNNKSGNHRNGPVQGRGKIIVRPVECQGHGNIVYSQMEQ